MSASHHRVRVTVERLNYSACGLQVGDYFEVDGSRLSLPPGQPFCYFAMQAALPLIASKAQELPADHWFERKPFVCCPDPAEGVVMRMDRL